MGNRGQRVLSRTGEKTSLWMTGSGDVVAMQRKSPARIAAEAFLGHDRDAFNRVLTTAGMAAKDITSLWYQLDRMGHNARKTEVVEIVDRHIRGVA